MVNATETYTPEVEMTEEIAKEILMAMETIALCVVCVSTWGSVLIANELGRRFTRK